MKAAILKAFGSPLAIETMPVPILGTGEVIVDVVATRVLSYANEILSGERQYLLDLPLVPGPGAIGRVRAIGPDATHLAAGDWVYCDPTVRSRDDALNPDITLQGLSARGEGGLRLQKHFRHGSWAEQMRVPTENVKPIGAIDRADAAQWCALGTLLVPYGGFLAANLQAGETVLVSGATGNFGSAAVAVALAMGAACVVAPGRNEKVLADLAYTPSWARPVGTTDHYPPTDPDDFAAFVHAQIGVGGAKLGLNVGTRIAADFDAAVDQINNPIIADARGGVE